MLHSDSFEALTNNGIHYLFGDNFEGQQFTLQFISFMPPPEAHQPFRYSPLELECSSPTAALGSGASWSTRPNAKPNVHLL